MFSATTPESSGPARGTRSRRRQRPLSSESITQQPKAKRQRRPLTEQTFVNPDAQPEMTEVKTDKVPKLDTRHSNSSIENSQQASSRRESSVRVKKSKHGDRAANKGDGSSVLTSTNAYTVSKLPALPDRIRSDWTGNQHAEIFSSFGYALTLTATHAIVWPYASTSQSPETFTFTLPSASKPNDPLPVGCLVSPAAASTEPGLVIVMSGSGKIVYWESISSAATFAFIKKDRSGVEHVISGMSSGEKVIGITNAESAGFVLTFNTGRLAYMSVRDSHGRPSVSVQFLRSNVAGSSSGIFGSIRHAFSNLSLRGDVAAVRADRSSRIGERNIVALTNKGRIQAWKLLRGGHHEPIGSSDIKDDLIATLHEIDPSSQAYPSDSFEALDCTFVPKGLEKKYLDLSRLSDAMATDNAMVQHLLLLVSLTKGAKSRFVLAEVILRADDCQIGMVRPITSYSSAALQTELAQTVRPCLYLPRPALVAFLVFDRATVIASLAVPPESPDSQLQSDTHILPSSFEDVVDFREDNVHEIIGSGFEEPPSAIQGSEDFRTPRYKAKNPAALLMVRGAGTVRVVTSDVDRFASDRPPQVTAKSKIEQAVFFGAKEDTPLTFGRKQEVKFPDTEIARAALDVSFEVLSSSTSYIGTLPASLEDNLRERSRALERLMTHLKTIGASLDRKTRWNLLYNAEKMEVAFLLWKLHESFTSRRPADDKKSLVGSIVEFIHQDQKSNPKAEIGEVDPVRHWFINDVFRLELFVAWAYEVIKTLYKDHLIDESKVTVLIREAVEINICTQKAALEFRQRNKDFYGLEREELELGILVDGYEGLPEPWTGCHYIANNIKRLVDLAQQWTEKNQETSQQQPKAANAPDPKLMENIATDFPVLADVMLVSVLEYARWAVTTIDQKKMGHEFAKTYQTDRYEKSILVARSGQWAKGARIAHRHNARDALAVILIDHLEEIEKALDTPGLDPEEGQRLRSTRDGETAELEDCLARFGHDFAFPMYDYLLANRGIQDVLNFRLDKLGFKTQFLRSRPDLARVSWIHDIQEENDVDHAANTLVDLAMGKEQQVWNKKIELSLGKLALLAETGNKGKLKTASKAKGRNNLKVNADEARKETALMKVDGQLLAIKIQDQLYSQVFPSAFNAVDDDFALKLAMEAHGGNLPRRQKALAAHFEKGMSRLLKHEALDPMTLIDLLTLVSLKPDLKDQIDNPFFLALKVAESAFRGQEARDAKRLIWRRLYTRDNWATLNDTQYKDDRQVVEQLGDTALFGALAECVRSQNPDEPFRPMPPSEVIGVFSDVDHDTTYQTKLRDAMKAEDKVIQTNLEKYRLAKWVGETFKGAQEVVANMADEATKAGLAALPAE